MKFDRTEIERKLEAEKAGWAKLKAKLMEEELSDEDGYPTGAALELVERWHWTDLGGLMEFVKSLWALRSWGWTEVDASELDPNDDDYNEDGGSCTSSPPADGLATSRSSTRLSATGWLGV